MNYRILVACEQEDDELLLSILRDAGHSVEVASSEMPSSQIEQMSMSCDLAIIDVDFASLESGWNLARQIRGAHSEKKIGLILLTRFFSYKKLEDADFLDWYDEVLTLPTSDEEVLGNIVRVGLNLEKVCGAPQKLDRLDS